MQRAITPAIGHGALTLLWLLVSAIILFRSHSFYPYIADDAYISMRYAARLLAGLGLTWNDGEYVEGYSNLLWVLSTALLGKLGMNLEHAVRALGVGCTLLTLSAFFWHSKRNHYSLFTMAAGALAFATAMPIAIWSIGGLEGPMVMLCMAWAVVLTAALLSNNHRPHAVALGMLLGLVCLLRPEGPIYTITLIIPLFLYAPYKPREKFTLLFIIAAIAASFFFAQTGFRWFYYGEIFANTVSAKVAFSEGRLQTGVGYVILTSLAFAVVWLYALIGNLHASKSSGTQTALWPHTALILPLLALVIAGGDIFPNGRAFMPLVPLFIIAFIDSTAHNLRIGVAYKEKLFVAFALAGHIALFNVSEANNIKKEFWVQNAAHIGKTLKEKYSKEQPLVAVYTAGAIPYYSELPSLDVLGLTDKRPASARKQLAAFGNELIGHELFDGEYINSKKPDILAFDVPGMGNICEKVMMHGCAALTANYHKRYINIPNHRVLIWVRNDSQKIKPN